MKKITSLFVAFGLVASLAVAGDGEGCPSQCKASEGKTTALATARKAIVDVPKASEKLTAEQQSEIKASREILLQTSFGKAMGPSFESCGRLMLAAAKQPGTTPEATALLMDMAATYCTVAKMFGGCADCACCEGAEDCCEACCGDMTPEEMVTKANESLASSKKLLAAAMEDAQKTTPEEMKKIDAAFAVLKQNCPSIPAMAGATKALNDGFASLAKMGIPASEGATARDELVKGAFELHGSLTACSSCEECPEAKETEKAEETGKSS